MKNILLISYVFKPIKGVASLRTSYWADFFSTKKNAYKIDAITSREESKQYSYVTVVSDTNASWKQKFIKDQGITWRKTLQEYLKTKKETYDVIILSGGPFMHFTLVPWLQKELQSKVILDFRDPFALNPRFENKKLKIWYKQYYEKQFIDNADHVITVNEYCKKLLTTRSDSKISVIENGYDDRIIDPIRITDKKNVTKEIRFVYAGKFTSNLSPECFLQNISHEKYKAIFEFKHVGELLPKLQLYYQSDNMEMTGLVSYEDAVKKIQASDIGVIFTKGDSFESTTKVFDYIGLEKPILIISDNPNNKGNLGEILQDYPKVFWVKNDQENIEYFLKSIKKENLEVTYSNRENFSRKHGAEQLEYIIRKVLG